MELFSAVGSLSTLVERTKKKVFMTQSDAGGNDDNYRKWNVFLHLSLISSTVIQELREKLRHCCNDNLILHFVYECFTHSLASAGIYYR